MFSAKVADGALVVCGGWPVVPEVVRGVRYSAFICPTVHSFMTRFGFVGLVDPSNDGRGPIIVNLVPQLGELARVQVSGPNALVVLDELLGQSEEEVEIANEYFGEMIRSPWREEEVLSAGVFRLRCEHIVHSESDVTARFSWSCLDGFAGKSSFRVDATGLSVYNSCGGRPISELKIGPVGVSRALSHLSAELVGCSPTNGDVERVLYFPRVQDFDGFLGLFRRLFEEVR